MILVFLLLSGCKIKEYTPEIPAAFEQSATVTSGDFSYSCIICKTERETVVNVTSTSADGLIMSCDGDRLSFTYGDFTHSVSAQDFESSNAAVIVYEVFEYINSSPELNARKIDGGFKYEGRICYGDFILIQNDDNSFASITFRKGDVSIAFETP